MARKQRFVVDAEKLTFGCRLQVLERRPDERIATAKMMVQKRSAGADRERVEPQAYLRQLDGHRVEIDAVDAVLEYVPLEQIHFRELVGIDRDALLAQGFKNVTAACGRGMKLTGLTGNWFKNVNRWSVI